MIHVALQPAKGSSLTDDEFNRWYEDEHVPLLAKCPGWLRSTRFELVDSRDPRDTASSAGNTANVSKYLACHEWQDERVVFASEEFRHATSTPWREKIMQSVDKATEERRRFKLWKQF